MINEAMTIAFYLVILIGYFSTSSTVDSVLPCFCIVISALGLSIILSVVDAVRKIVNWYKLRKERLLKGQKVAPDEESLENSIVRMRRKSTAKVFMSKLNLSVIEDEKKIFNSMNSMNSP
jgi:hypothetical protein